MRRLKTADQYRPYVDLLDRQVIFARRDDFAFRRIRQQYPEVREWFASRCGWAVILTHDLARLVKTPALLSAGMGFRWAQRPLDYELFTWVLWYAEKIQGDQFLLTDLAREIEAQASAVVGVGHIDWNQYDHRQALRRALSGLEELGALRRIDREIDEWVYRGVGEALYEFTSLVPHLHVNLPTDLFVRLAVQMDTAALAEPLANSGSPEQRLYRTLLLSPALFRADDPEAFALLQTRDRRRTIVNDIGSRLGWDLEITESYACLLRPSASDASEPFLFPFRGALCHALLLLLSRLRELVAARELGCDGYDRISTSRAQLRSEIMELRSRWGQNWGTTFSRLPAQQMADDIEEALRVWGLVQGPDVDDQVLILPLAARFTGVYRDDGLSAEGDDA